MQAVSEICWALVLCTFLVCCHRSCEKHDARKCFKETKQEKCFE